jgi:Cd2+/Zn2+-exporting ATPase
VGIIAIEDRVRPEARRSIEALRRSGVRRIVMLTGDNEGTARSVAGRLGVDEVHAELLPEDKVTVVRGLLSKGEWVAFVGDGVNDAPALAAATVGLAMGAAGTDVALETADIALMGDDLTRLPFAVERSRKTLAIIQQNRRRPECIRRGSRGDPKSTEGARHPKRDSGETAERQKQVLRPTSPGRYRRRLL